MFDAIHHLETVQECDLVVTVYAYVPDDIPQSFESWGRFAVFPTGCRISAELSSAEPDHGRYSVARYGLARPLVTDRVDR